MAKLAPPTIEKLSSEKQQRLHELLDRNSEGEIAPSERTELEELVEAAERLMVANARRLSEFAQREGEHPPKGAVPVTIWVTPQTVGT